MFACSLKSKSVCMQLEKSVRYTVCLFCRVNWGWGGGVGCEIWTELLWRQYYKADSMKQTYFRFTNAFLASKESLFTKHVFWGATRVFVGCYHFVSLCLHMY